MLKIGGDKALKKNHSNISNGYGKDKLKKNRHDYFDKNFRKSLTRKNFTKTKLISTKNMLETIGELESKTENEYKSNKFSLRCKDSSKNINLKYSKFSYLNESGFRKNMKTKSIKEKFKSNFTRKKVKVKEPFKFINSKLGNDFSFTKNIKTVNAKMLSKLKTPQAKHKKSCKNISIDSFDHMTKSELTIENDQKIGNEIEMNQPKSKRNNNVTLNNVLKRLNKDKELNTKRKQIRVS